MKVVHDIRIDWQSTPALWRAYRDGDEEFQRRNPDGYGKTPTIALADLLEKELDHEPA